jgi:hypothetical protein
MTRQQWVDLEISLITDVVELLYFEKFDKVGDIDVDLEVIQNTGRDIEALMPMLVRHRKYTGKDPEKIREENREKEGNS